MDMQEINDEIAKLEHSETNWHNCEKLSILYMVRDGMSENKNENVKKGELLPQNAYSYSKSEFLTAAQKAPITEVLNVINDHLEAVRVLYPKEYAAVVRKINEIGRE